MECVQLTLDDWIQMKQRLRQELLGVKQSFVRIGYVLRQIEDQKFYKQDGYKSIAEFAQAEYGLGASITSRFMSINREYSVGGYSEHLREEYAELGRSQLEEMLKLPDSDRQMIQPETAREDIRGLKRFNKSEPAAGEADDLGALIERFYRENPEIYNELAGKTFEESNIGQFTEIVNPAGNRSYKKGLFFLMMYENRVTFKKFGGTPENKTWWEFYQLSEPVLKRIAKEMEEPEEKKEEIPEKMPEEPTEEPAEVKEPEEELEEQVPEPEESTPQEEKSEDITEMMNPPKEEIAPAQKSDETKENQGVPEKEEEQKQVPGQTELTRDSPEYCPTQTRKSYIDTLSTADAAVYISHGLNVVILAYPEKVQKWLEQEVDSKGEAIEK